MEQARAFDNSVDHSRRLQLFLTHGSVRRLPGAIFLCPGTSPKNSGPSTTSRKPSVRSILFTRNPSISIIAKYKGAKEVPIFASKFVVPVIYINDLKEYLQEGSPFLRYLRESKRPFGVLINYGTIQMTEAEGRAVWALLNGELRNQFLGWVSGESIGYVYTSLAPTELKISPSMSRAELLEAHRVFYTSALDKKWSAIFHTPTGADVGQTDSGASHFEYGLCARTG